MRTTLLILALWTAAGPSYAREAKDKLASWRGASTEEKASLINELSKREGNGARAIIKCVDEAAAVPGHTDLSIGEIVESCMSSKDEGEPT